jgi:cbb3-type cytochrome oxidase subunit 3
VYLRAYGRTILGLLALVGLFLGVRWWMRRRTDRPGASRVSDPQ